MSGAPSPVRAIVVIVATWLALVTGGCSGGPPQEAPSGSAAVAGVPDWVPIYPGARVSGVETRNTGVETYTTFQLDSKSDCQKVFAWYDEKLKVAGFDVVKSTSSSGGCSGIMRAEGPGHTRALNLNGGGAAGGPSQMGLQAVARQLPGAPAAGGETDIPAWVPRYPGAKPANVVASQQGPERRVDFSFTTADDAGAVIGWYERQLTSAQFTVVGSTVFDGSTAKLTAQDPTGRSIVNVRIEPAGGRKVVAIEAREGIR